MTEQERNIARMQRDHHAELADVHQAHADALFRLEHALLLALETMRHPDDLPVAVDIVRDARRKLADHRAEVDEMLWHEQVHRALDPDVRPLHLDRTA